MNTFPPPCLDSLSFACFEAGIVASYSDRVPNKEASFGLFFMSSYKENVEEGR